MKERIKEGHVIPFIGMGVFKGITNAQGLPLPYDSDSMILALNGGRAMSPRLMYEYSRAAMSIEQRKGRAYVEALCAHIFQASPYPSPSVYTWLKSIMPHYVIDLNLDDTLLNVYEAVDHFLVTGVSRVMGGYERYVVYMYHSNTKSYSRIDPALLSPMLPIVFKPLGCVVPEKQFILSDADFVDWLTEAMGGYGVPPFLKRYRESKEYLFLGMDFSRDTFRMVTNELTLDLSGGLWVDEKKALSKKEEKFLASHNIKRQEIALETFIAM